MDEAQRLREQAIRYRRMMLAIDDKKTRGILEGMAVECDWKAEQLPIPQEQRPEAKTC